MKKCCLLYLLIPFFIHTAGQSTENALLWRIDGSDGSKPSYIYGTIHVGKSEFLRFSDSLYNAINNTDCFFTEIDFSKSLLELAMGNENYFDKKEKHLDSVIKTTGWKKMVERINVKYNKHINPDSLDQFLDFTNGKEDDIFTPDPGLRPMDMMLSEYAASLGKKTGGLETILFQLDLIYQLLDLKLADSTVNMDDEARLTTGIKKFYLAEQTDSIAQMFSTMNAAFINLMLNNRNTTMADSIVRHVNNGPCFFAVGCGHLVGDAGLISLLRKKGFAVTPIPSSRKIPVQQLNWLNEAVQEGIKNAATALNPFPGNQTPEQQQAEKMQAAAKKILDAEKKKSTKKKGIKKTG